MKLAMLVAIVKRFALVTSECVSQVTRVQVDSNLCGAAWEPVQGK
jgi:hypothetical protein